MRPAFTSIRQATAFGLLMLAVLLSPVLAGKVFLPSREQAYSTQGWGNGPYPWVQNQIFQETNAIDIAFMGSSHILHAIDTPYVQAQLTKKLGRPAVVRTIAWGGAGYDALYLIAQDLMVHRQVKMLVFYDENNALGFRNSAATTWFRFGENAPVLLELPLCDQSFFYLASIVGMPRNLLALARSNLPAPLVSNPPNYWESHYHSDSVVKLLGATRSELGFNYDTASDNFTMFKPFVPKTGVTPAAAEIYSSSDKKDFAFGNTVLPRWQEHFARALGELARTNNTKLVLLNIPVFADVHETSLQERTYWPDIFGQDLSIVGIPPAKLFDGLTEEELHWLFTNNFHFNKNGMQYFTPLVTPALLQVFEGSGKL